MKIEYYLCFAQDKKPLVRAYAFKSHNGLKKTLCMLSKNGTGFSKFTKYTVKYIASF